MSKSNHRVFVYGTLRKGLRLHHCIEAGRWICDARVQGRLHDVGTYPALVLDSSGLVQGEVWEVNDQLLDDLDTVEGYRPGASGNLYERRSVMAIEESGREIAVQVYEWNSDVDDLELIEMGEVTDYSLWLRGN